MTVTEVLNFSPETYAELTSQELRRATKILADAANKRIKRVQKSGVVSPAVENVLDTGGRFRISGKTGTELDREFQRARAFLKDETSTVRGARRVQEDILKAGASGEKPEIFTIQQWKDVYKAMDLARESPDTKAQIYDISEKVIQFLTREKYRNRDLTAEDLYMRAKDFIEKEYRRAANVGGAFYAPIRN